MQNDDSGYPPPLTGQNSVSSGDSGHNESMSLSGSEDNSSQRRSSIRDDDSISRSSGDSGHYEKPDTPPVISDITIDVTSNLQPHPEQSEPHQLEPHQHEPHQLEPDQHEPDQHEPEQNEPDQDLALLSTNTTTSYGDGSYLHGKARFVDEIPPGKPRPINLESPAIDSDGQFTDESSTSDYHATAQTTTDHTPMNHTSSGQSSGSIELYSKMAFSKTQKSSEDDPVEEVVDTDPCEPVVVNQKVEIQSSVQPDTSGQSSGSIAPYSQLTSTPAHPAFASNPQTELDEEPNSSACSYDEDDYKEAIATDSLGIDIISGTPMPIRMDSGDDSSSGMGQSTSGQSDSSIDPYSKVADGKVSQDIELEEISHRGKEEEFDNQEEICIQLPKDMSRITVEV